MGRPWSRAPIQPCGTKAAYQRHMRHGEEACDPCKKARLAYQRDRYDRMKPDNRRLELAHKEALETLMCRHVSEYNQLVNVILARRHDHA